MIKVKRLMKHDLGILTARSSEGKTMALVNFILSLQDKYDTPIWCFGLKQELVSKLKIKPFQSLIELEKIRDSFIIIDEVGLLFELDNRKNKKQVDLTLRMVNHNNNKILLSGLPSDFKKYICAKAKYYLFKGLKISDLINGSEAKEVVNQYRNELKGTFMLNVPIDKMLCYDGNYWIEHIDYLKQYDTKRDNSDLFQLKKVKNGKTKKTTGREAEVSEETI